MIIFVIQYNNNNNNYTNFKVMKRFDLIASVKGLIKDKAYEAGNGITMVTSNRAGIALTFADSDLGMYITYMETLA